MKKKTIKALNQLTESLREQSKTPRKVILHNKSDITKEELENFFKNYDPKRNKQSN